MVVAAEAVLAIWRELRASQRRLLRIVDTLGAEVGRVARGRRCVVARRARHAWVPVVSHGQRQHWVCGGHADAGTATHLLNRVEAACTAPVRATALRRRL